MSGTDTKGHRQRLRDRFGSGQASSHSEEALIELLLTYAIPQKDVKSLAARLLAEYGNLPSLLEAPIEKLTRSEGIKENSAVLFKLVDWIRQNYGIKGSVKETPAPPIQGTFFEPAPREQITRTSPRQKKRIQRPGSGMFGKAMLKEAIRILPSLPESESLDEIRSFVRSNLHFSAEQTRERNASYIIRRMFPEGLADYPLRAFAKAFPDTQELRDVCFYRFLRAERLEQEAVEDLILTNLGTGKLTRDRIRQYLKEKFPEIRSIGDCGQAIVDALSAAGIVNADRTKISFAYRDIPLPSFAFVLHSEFPEPGMYDIRKLTENRMIRAMLWNPERILHSLYELRNQSLISKVSEIDNIRQFTIKHKLAGVVEQIISGRKTA